MNHETQRKDGSSVRVDTGTDGISNMPMICTFIITLLSILISFGYKLQLRLMRMSLAGI